MVEIASNTGDRASYRVPLFKLAAALPAKLGASTDIAPLGLDAHLKREGFASSKAVVMGGLGPYPLLTVPAILQEAYDTLHLPGKPPLAFYTVLAMQYRDKNGQKRQYNSYFNAKSAHDESLKADLENFMRNNAQRIEGAICWTVVASPEEKLALPATQLANRVQDIHDTMFDRDRYEEGEHKIAEGLIKGMRLAYDSANSADKLLAPMVSVYGGRIFLPEPPDGTHDIIVSETAFTAMEQEEKPERYRGRK